MTGLDQSRRLVWCIFCDNSLGRDDCVSKAKDSSMPCLGALKLTALSDSKNHVNLGNMWKEVMETFK